MNDKSAKTGVLLAIAAYSMWGVAPLYFKLLLSMPAIEILMHRIIWSMAVLILLVLLTRQMPKVRAALQTPKVMLILLVSGVLLAGNWLLFIWSVNNDHLLDASLGYYINPLLNVFLGRIFLAEKLRPLQQVAVVLAIVGVMILIVSFGQIPWIALGLACSFGVYGLLRKQVAVDSLPGLLVETGMMLPFAVGYWLWFASGASNLLNNTLEINLILFFAGVVTTAPLLCFTGAARRIKYSTLGFFQYIGPSMMFVLAVYLYGEVLSEARLVTFAFVWLALGVFSFDSFRQYRRMRRLA
ncbi:MAG: chloramphenicol-sensitive protein RarD [Paraglaciecola sp.]|jgi:chloramphenicol-sensitive protein RarD